MQSSVRTTRERAFTLVETALSLALISILLAGMGSLIVVSARSLPDRNRPSDQIASAATVLEQLAADVTAATTVREATATTLVVEVPDRDQDAKPESIRYECNLAKGTLVRSYNGSPATLASKVNSFSLSYSTKVTSTTLADNVDTTAEALVSTYTGGLLYTGRIVTDTNIMIGQNIRPTFSAATRSWTITRAQLWSKVDGANTGVSRVQIRLVGPDGKPTATVLAQGVLNESALGANYGLNEFVFTDAPPLLPGEEVAIVIGCSSNCPSVNVGYVGLSLLRPLPMSTTNNGSSWTINGLAVIPHNVWATTQVTVPNSTATKQFQDMEVKLQIGDSPELSTTIVAANTPEVQ